MSQQQAVILFMAMSLDGYIADAKGGVDWLAEAKGENDNGYAGFYQQVDTLIMGRRTYDQLQGMGCNWPYADKTCYVLTHKAPAADPYVEFAKGEESGLLRHCWQRSRRHIWLVGGGQTARNFLDKGLVDEVLLAMIPTLLGKGIPLFQGNVRRNFSLAKQTQYGDIGMLHYHVRK